MDFGFTPEQENFRSEVRNFLNTELPPGFVDFVGPTVDDCTVNTEEGWQVFRDLAHKMGQKGWLSLFWPKKFGGQECSHVDYLIFLEEIARRGSPGYNAVGAKMFAPTLMQYGTEAQKELHLNAIRTGDEFWCEGFSEPEAGSDLGGLQTKAVRDGNNYVINGQKTWSTFANYANWCTLLVRTDLNSRGYKGLSFFMLDLKTPGVTVNPIINILGEPDFSEIFLDDVKISADNRVGEENQGWSVVQTMLSFERAAIAQTTVVHTLVERAGAYLKQHCPPELREIYYDRLAHLKVESEIGRLMGYRVACLQDEGKANEIDSAMAKLYGSYLFKRAGNEVLSMLGSFAQYDESSELAPLHGWFRHFQLASLGATLAAGSSEVQKNIVAWRGLTMPRV